MNKPLSTRFQSLLWLRFAAIGLLLSFLSFPLAAQQPAAKRPLTHADYDSWRSIQSPQLSRDGRFVAYFLNPQEGDGEIVVKNLATGSEWRHTRGSRPEPTATAETGDQRPAVPARGPGGPGGPGGGGASFTPDGRSIVFQIFPSKAESEAAARQRPARPEETPRNRMGIMNLETGAVKVVERVRRFVVPEEDGVHIAYLLEPKPEERRPEDRRAEGAAGAGAPQRPAQGQAGGAAAARRSATPTREYGSDLVLLNLADQSERAIPDVQDFQFTKDGKTLVYTVASRKEEANGIYRLPLGTAVEPAALISGKGRYTRLTWDENQSLMAFLSDRDDAAAKQPRVKLYVWDRHNTAAVELLSADTPGFPKGHVLAERGGLSFSQDGSRLFFATSAAAEPAGEEAEETPAPTEEKAVADLWHWKDDFIQPMQKVRAEQERNRTYRSVFHIREKKLVPLADESMADVNPSSDGRWAIGSDDRSYRILVGVDTNYSDYYLVNTLDGNRKPLLQKKSGGLTWSPNGRYALFFDGRNWNTISIPDGKTTNLTHSLGVAFWQENHDSPGTPGSYGNAGWTKDEKHVLLYDRYDIWQVAPDGAGAVNLTEGVGRKERVAFRLVRLDPQERTVDAAAPLLLRAENEWTRDTGFYRDRIGGGLPEKLVMAAKSFGSPSKAKSADVYLLTASTFNEYPDLLVTGPDFKNMRKVSDANPQRSGLLWGSAELIRYRNLDGRPLSGILYKPENFDPGRKYPMLVYIYETLSERLHRFVDPRPGHSINTAYYVSNGYLVLTPDIVYTIGYPGQSALKCVLPAIQAVVDMGFVDEKAIGIQGHSWGGYQIAYMVTQTHRFKAAAPGALVANMTSAYSGIRWGTGLPRQFQYERTQSRIGGSLWEYPMRFIENSPVFMADRVQTPLLMLHNDNDDAVPWYQGIEYFLALRRLGKEAYMFNYNGEPHGLRKRVNQKDYTVRLQQFFDHHLKGAPMPEWMERGIPFLEREKEKERVNITTSPN